MTANAMRNLYFVRLVNHVDIATYYGQWNVTFALTALNEKDAGDKAMQLINPQYVNDYKVDKVEFICLTPNDVDGFETV